MSLSTGLCKLDMIPQGCVRVVVSPGHCVATSEGQGSTQESWLLLRSRIPQHACCSQDLTVWEEEKASYPQGPITTLPPPGSLLEFLTPALCPGTAWQAASLTLPFVDLSASTTLELPSFVPESPEPDFYWTLRKY